MKLVIIFGPQAVGKMTVGHELEKITGLKLFHNHMTIDLVSPFFSYGTPEGKRLVKLFREEIFKAVSASDMEGMIFTFLWAFDDDRDRAYLQHVSSLFTEKGGEVCYVELEADTEERLVRNKTEHRLAHKPSKRDTNWSENELKNSMLKHRFNSTPGEVGQENYLRIENTHLEPSVAAAQIKERFNL